LKFEVFLAAKDLSPALCENDLSPALCENDLSPALPLKGLT